MNALVFAQWAFPKLVPTGGISGLQGIWKCNVLSTMVASVCNFSTWEIEAGGLPVDDQLRLQSETLSPPCPPKKSPISSGTVRLLSVGSVSVYPFIPSPVTHKS